jgi:hypothetical protein
MRRPPYQRNDALRDHRIAMAAMGYRDAERTLCRLLDLHRTLGRYAPFLRMLTVAGELVDVDITTIVDAIAAEADKFERAIGVDES